jgi:HB1, ASXL, restriction endonuclease HTH domain
MADCTEGNYDKISAAIEGAADELQYVEKELGELQTQLQQLQQRAAQLQDFIGLGKLLLGKQEPSIQMVTPEESELTISTPAFHGTIPRRLSAGDYAKQVLEEVGRPMRAQEMANYLTQRGLMRGKWTREVLRTAMRKNQEIFERVAEGVYALKAWSPEQKSLIEHGMQSLFTETKGEDSEESQADAEPPHNNPNTNKPFTIRVIELLEDSNSSMSPLEMRQEFARRGKHVTKEKICGVLSKLAKDRRIHRPEPGRYSSANFQDPYLAQDGQVLQEVVSPKGFE